MKNIDTLKQARLNDNVFSYTDSQLKGAIPLIFIHDFSLSQNIWKHQVDEFKNRYRVITYDVRGHGKSGTGDGHYTIDLFVEDLSALMEYLGLEKAILCGLSMGGYIALRTIELHPEKVQGLVLCNTNSYADSNEEKIQRFNNIRKLKTLGVSDLASEVVNELFNPAIVDKKQEEVIEIKKIIEANTLTGLCGTLLAVASRTDTSQYLKQIRVPTLIITGEKDNDLLPLDSQYLNHFITGSEMHTIKGTRKILNIENPEEFNSVLNDFLCLKFQENTSYQAGTTIMMV